MKRSSDEHFQQRKQSLSTIGNVTSDSIESIDNLDHDLQNTLELLLENSDTDDFNVSILNSNSSENSSDKESLSNPDSEVASFKNSRVQSKPRSKSKPKKEKQLNLNVAKNMDLVNSVDDPEERKKLIAKLKRRKEFPRILKTDVRWSLPQMWLNTLSAHDFELLTAYLDKFCHATKCEHIYYRVAGFHDPLHVRTVGVDSIAQEVFIRTSRAPDMVVTIAGCRIRRSKQFSGAIIETDIVANFTKVFEAFPMQQEETSTEKKTVDKNFNIITIQDETPQGSSNNSATDENVHQSKPEILAEVKEEVKPERDMNVTIRNIRKIIDDYTNTGEVPDVAELVAMFPSLPLLLNSPALSHLSERERLKLIIEQFKQNPPPEPPPATAPSIVKPESNALNSDANETPRKDHMQQKVIKEEKQENNKKKLPNVPKEEFMISPQRKAAVAAQLLQTFDLVLLSEPLKIELRGKLIMVVDEDNLITRLELIDQSAKIAQGDKFLILPPPSSPSSPYSNTSNQSTF